MILTIVLHCVVGTVFALTGIWARNFCAHRRHQIMVGAAGILIEATLTSIIVG